MSRAAGPVSAFIDRHFRHFNAAALNDAADGYSRHVDVGRADARHAGRGDEHGRARHLARRDDPRRQGARDLLHRREPRGGRLQPGRALPLRARAALPRPHAATTSRRCSIAISTASPTPAFPRKRRCAGSSASCSRSGSPPTRQASALFPHEFLYRVLRSKVLEPLYEIDPRDSWLLAASDADLPIFVPGLGGLDARQRLRGARDRRPLHSRCTR